MRIVFILLLFQFIAPAFLSIGSQSLNCEEQKSMQLQDAHSSILFPLILKEKEENEKKEGATTFVPTQLIDFTDHSLALAELHESKHNPMLDEQQYAHQPLLFTLFCSYII